MTDQIKPDPKNARRHTPRNKGLIRQSLEERGAFRSIGVDGDGIIRAGNGVYEQALELGMKVRVVEAAPDELIAVRRSDLTGDKAERAALFDNKTAETSEWDEDVLALLARDEPETLEGIFDGGELAALLEESEQKEQQQRELGGETKKRDFGNIKEKIRPVLHVSQLADFERAILATGQINRGEAIMTICRDYLERHASNE